MLRLIEMAMLTVSSLRDIMNGRNQKFLFLPNEKIKISFEIINKSTNQLELPPQVNLGPFV
jgi:hypothetical protein